jgi:hypothetical protein
MAAISAGRHRAGAGAGEPRQVAPSRAAAAEAAERPAPAGGVRAWREPRSGVAPPPREHAHHADGIFGHDNPSANQEYMDDPGHGGQDRPGTWWSTAASWSSKVAMESYSNR